jgi:hypothetical protein
LEQIHLLDIGQVLDVYWNHRSTWKRHKNRERCK